jgi:CBS domain-containing protein
VKKTIASDVMTSDVLTVAEDLPVNRLVELLIDHSISGAPVIARDGTPIGVVSLTDLARNGALIDGTPEAEAHAYYRQGLDRQVARGEMASLRVGAESSTTVRDIMTPVVFSVEVDTPVQEVADAMIRGRIHRVFVTRRGTMVGIISSMDLLPVVRDM